MGGIRIVSTGHAHMHASVSNDDLAQKVDTSNEWIVSRTGIQQRYFVQEDTSQLAYEACMDAIKQSDIDIHQIRYIFVATLSADQPLPNVSSMLQTQLGLTNEVLAFDLNAACSGFIYALQVANGMVKENEYALVVGAEKLSKFLDFNDRSTCVLFGDGAGACIVEKSENPLYQYAQVHSDIAGNLTLQHKIHMNGSEVFRFAVAAMRRSIQNVLDQANATMDDIDLVISHQANIRIIDHVAKKMKITNDKMYTNVQNYGNTSAASVAIALSCANEEGRLKRGMNVVLVGFGGGLTNGAMYFKW